MTNRTPACIEVHPDHIIITTNRLYPTRIDIKPVDRRFPSGRSCIAELRLHGSFEGHVMTDANGRAWIDNAMGRVVGSELDVMEQNDLAARIAGVLFDTAAD